MPRGPGQNEKRGVASPTRSKATPPPTLDKQNPLPSIRSLMWRRAVAAALRPARARAASSLPPCPYTPPPYDGPPVAEVLALRRRYLNPGERGACSGVWCLRSPVPECRKGGGGGGGGGVSTVQNPIQPPHPYTPPPPSALLHHFKRPVMITDGHMQYLYDETGRRYLDVREREREEERGCALPSPPWPHPPRQHPLFGVGRVGADTERREGGARRGRSEGGQRKKTSPDPPTP